MGFLIKTAFWLSLVLLVIPFGGKGDDGAQASVGPIETFIAAQSVIGDVAGLCERQPETCEFGREALQTIGTRARQGARIAYGLLDEHFSDEEMPIHTGSVATTTTAIPTAKPVD